MLKQIKERSTFSFSWTLVTGVSQPAPRPDYRLTLTPSYHLSPPPLMTQLATASLWSPGVGHSLNTAEMIIVCVVITPAPKYTIYLLTSMNRGQVSQLSRQTLGVICSPGVFVKMIGLQEEYHIMVLVLSSSPGAGDPSDFNERDRKRAQKVGIMRDSYTTPFSSLY